MGWIKVSGRTLRFSGTLTKRNGFDEWAREDGRSAIEELASQRRFSLFGRTRGVKNSLWNDLKTAARSHTLSSAIQKEVDAYLKLTSELAVTRMSLPRTRRLRSVVVVPRVLLNGAALHAISARLGQHPELQSMTGGDALREYFCRQLVKELDGALVGSSPSLSSPMKTTGEWVVIGIDQAFSWMPQLWTGSDWRGHYFLYEAFQSTIRRSDRKDIDKQVRELAETLVSLDRTQINDILSLAQQARRHAS
jgi:hypothetical protein